MQSDFTNINVVPIGNEFFDFTTLSRVIHPSFPRKAFKMKRLRKFYTRKVNKTHLTFRVKLSTILYDFPRLDSLHPLYSDLLRLVFDRDRYKFALGQVNAARHLITNIATHYVNLLEFAESLKDCKSLKASAVSGMFSVINEITPSLAYLEQLRQHMVSLPLIDTNTPTILVSGYPHVDKTYFMSSINTGDVVHQFTTKSVTFAVGYTDHNDLKYQVIDAPGVLDKPVFGDCYVITALARHLPDALVLFFLDVSGSCGYSVADQVAFFHSVKSLFPNKPLLIVCDETDLIQVSEQGWKLIEEMNSGMGAEEEEVGLKISNLRTEEGVICVRNVACERLLDQRERLSCIAEEKARILRNKYIVAHQECKDHISPQNLDDHHKVSDLFVDSDVLFRLEELDPEVRVKQSEEEEEEDDDDFVMAEERFTEEHKNQLVAIRKIQPLRIIALVFSFPCRECLSCRSTMSLNFKFLSLLSVSFLVEQLGVLLIVMFIFCFFGRFASLFMSTRH